MNGVALIIGMMITGIAFWSGHSMGWDDGFKAAMEERRWR